MFETSKRGNLLMEMVLFCRAIPLARPRIGIKKIVYQPLENQVAMRKEMKAYAIPKPFKIPLWLSVHAFYDVASKGDLDNIVKGVADNLTFTGIIDDDRLVRGITATFEEAVEDYVLIRLSEVSNAATGLSS